MSTYLNALILGDIVGHSGCRALFGGLKELVKKYKADLVIVNGENAADGFGLTPEIADRLLDLGVDVITTGNHVWQKKEIIDALEKQDTILRPANYPKTAPGKGLCIVERKGHRIAVANLQGRVRMYDIDCPFDIARAVLRQIKDQTKIILIDFHAEDTEEKEALGIYLDGKISAVFGTHTHIQTADERILPGGTAYITDLGMTGPVQSVIGVEPDIAIQRSLSQMPLKMTVSDNPSVIQGIFLQIDPEDGKPQSISRIQHTSAF